MINTSSITDQEAHDLLRRGLQDLLLFFPLCGLSILGEAVEVVEDHSLDTIATDGRRIYYSPQWALENDTDGRVFDLLHEWLHIFFNHPARCGDRDQLIWNIACDCVVIHEACEVLTRSGGKKWDPPKDGIQPPDWTKGLSAEEIYDILHTKEKPPPPQGGGGGEHNTGTDFQYDRVSPPGMPTPGEEEFKRKFSEEIAQAVLVQQQINGNRPLEELFGTALAKRVDEVLNGNVPWSRLLRGRLLSDMGYDEPSYAPPNLLYYPEIVLPQMRSLKAERLMLPIDVSASVGPTLMGTFKANVIPAAMRATETIIVTFDAVVREVVRTRHPKRALDQIEFITGAHSYTSTVEVFELVEKFKPKALACLTDGHVYLPAKAYPETVWVIPQNGKKQPWGRTFRMEVSW